MGLTICTNGPVIVGDAEEWGFIPDFLSIDNPEPAWKQIDANYRHGGGWDPQPKWEIVNVDLDTGVARAKYPGDPEMKSRSFMTFRDEVLFLFPHSYVMLKGKSGEWELSRLD